MKFQKFGEATKGMDAAKKREYIWMYYKGHIISAVCVLALGIYSSYQFATRTEPFFYVVFTGGNTNMENLSQLEQRLNGVLIPDGINGNHSVVARSLGFSVAEDALIGTQEAEALMLMLAVGDLDIVVFDEVTFNHFANLGALAPLDGFGALLPADAIVYHDGEPLGIRGDAIAAFDGILLGGEWIVASGAGSHRPGLIGEFLGYALP
ncbi:MAG: hypothetical protein FWF59_04085 [Turicibacter sp.]|nr:hypothetical protein [Turicibacter sp.]